MDELLTFLERYAPGYRALIKGVYDWELDELEVEFGKPLPNFYREFARLMGEEGGLLLSQVEAYNPHEIIELYRLGSRDMPPRRFLYVFGDTSVADHHYWLDLEAPSESEDYLVVRAPIGRDTWTRSLTPRYVSLREMLFYWAMSNVRLPAFAHGIEYLHRSFGGVSPEPPDAEQVALKFEQLGFVRLPYPRRCILFERADAAIALYRHPSTQSFSFKVGMSEPDEFRRFQAVVGDIPGLEKW